MLANLRFGCCSAVSETKRMEAIPTSPQRHIVAGLAAVVGGLVAPFEKASHIHDRPILDWLWASGHHPFGPFSNTSSVSHLLRDTAMVSFHAMFILSPQLLSFNFCIPKITL